MPNVSLKHSTRERTVISLCFFCLHQIPVRLSPLRLAPIPVCPQLSESRARHCVRDHSFFSLLHKSFAGRSVIVILKQLIFVFFFHSLSLPLSFSISLAPPRKAVVISRVITCWGEDSSTAFLHPRRLMCRQQLSQGSLLAQ